MAAVIYYLTLYLFTSIGILFFFLREACGIVAGHRFFALYIRRIGGIAANLIFETS